MTLHRPARALGAEQRDDARFTTLVLADILPDRIRRAGGIEQVVERLESVTQMPSEGAQALPLLLVCTGNDRSTFDGGLHQDAVFAWLKRAMTADRRRGAGRANRIPDPEKTMGTDGMRQQAADRRAGRTIQNIRARHDGIGLIQKADRSQDGNVFAEDAVCRRLSAPHSGVIHAGKVIEEE